MGGLFVWIWGRCGTPKKVRRDEASFVTDQDVVVKGRMRMREGMRMVRRRDGVLGGLVRGRSWLWGITREGKMGRGCCGGL